MMIKKYLILLFLIGFLLLHNCERDASPLEMQEPFIKTGGYNGAYWPTDDWRSCAPEAVGVDSKKLMQAYEYAANPAINTEGIIIVKDGYIIGEAYLNGFDKNMRHESYSIAKSFSSALIGMAIDKGHIPGVDAFVYNYYPAWQASSTQRAKKRITLRHLLTMTDGLQWNEEDYYDDTSQNDVFIMGAQYDYISYVLNKPVINDPGSYWYYSSGASMLLSGIIETACGMSAYNFAWRHLFVPLGMPDVQMLHDRAGHTVTAWGVQATLREFAKFGYLYLKKGKWEDKQIISESWVNESTAPASAAFNHYAYQWWLPAAYENHEDFDIPEGTFLGIGIYIQILYVVPAENLVVVRLGNDAGGPWHSLKFLRLILDAVN